MKNSKINKTLTSAFLAFAMLMTPLAAFAQTRISMPKNKYKVEDDVKLGRQASAEVEQQMPILNDSYVSNYVQNVGDRLVNAIPSEFDNPQFRYTFRVVNARDINAFALPGGPMYVNRGMIEAAKTEGEMAGVMAHEISHVALRHATAQATKQSSIGNQILGIGAILGGAVLGGETGAQLGAVFAQGWFTRYSRDYETQADVLGSQIMARAGYDPRDLANMFRTIEQQSGGGSGTPEWLSSHPNPANRYQRINQEAALLRVTNPVQDTRDFREVQSRLGRLPRAGTMAEIAQNGQRNPSGGSTTSSGRYSRRVEFPSTRYRSYDSNWLRVSAPDNWQQVSSGNTLTFAPDGGYGESGITHGVMIGVAQSNNTNLRNATQSYISELLQSNNYLRQRGNYTRGSIDRREALSTTLSGTSPITGQTEVVTIYTTLLDNQGNLMYVAAVAPQNESGRYNSAFNSIINSLQISVR